MFFVDLAILDIFIRNCKSAMLGYLSALIDIPGLFSKISELD